MSVTKIPSSHEQLREQKRDAVKRVLLFLAEMARTGDL